MSDKPISVTIIPNTTGMRLVEPVTGEDRTYCGLSEVPILAWRVEVWGNKAGDFYTIHEPVCAHGEHTSDYLLRDGDQYIWPGNREFSSEADALTALNEHLVYVENLRARVQAKKATANG